jgi:hypothetical protein
MATANKPFDVLVSHSPKDAALAMDIANACRESGIEAATSGELLRMTNAGDVLWDALAESRALLTVISPAETTTSMGLEIGAARAWNKPIYAVVTDPTSTHLPAGLTGTQAYTIGRLQDVIRAIQVSAEQLTEEDRTHLSKLYADMKVSADQLALDSRQLERFVNRFERITGKAVSGERLLSELLRLRKQGKLLRSRSGSRPSRPKRKPA